MVLCFVYRCNHNSLWESWKFYRFRIRAVYAVYKPCSRAMYTAMSCVHGPYTAVYTAEDTAHTRPYTQTMYTAVCTRTVYRCTRLVHGGYTAVYGPWRVHDHVHGRIQAVYMVVYTCIRPVDDRGHGPCTQPWPCTRHGRVHVHAVYTVRVHGRVRTMYTKQQLNN